MSKAQSILVNLSMTSSLLKYLGANCISFKERVKTVAFAKSESCFFVLNRELKVIRVASQNKDLVLWYVV